MTDIRTTFLALPPFTQGYIECALWADANAECLSVEGDGEGEEDATLDDLSPELLSTMARDCAVFEEDNQEDIAAVADTFGLRDREHLGHDFWLSRNGHGTGFWDRGLGDIGERLHTAAQRVGSQDLYRGDDGLIHG